jgi:hypothetical protein
MNRIKFISIVGGTIGVVGATAYLLSDRSNLSRADLKPTIDDNRTLKPEEKEILFLASLAPSGHNTQPWFVRYLAPYHWIIGNDRSKWLPAVDPTQRETMLSIGAFLQNLEYAASSFGYGCDWKLLATTNQDERVMEVKLKELANWTRFSNQYVEKYCDGLTTAGMEINGIPGWVVRNFYDKDNVMTNDFRERSIDKVQKEVSESAGWILITSQDNSVQTLLEMGRRMERLFLKVRERNIVIHPMTQILEEPSTSANLNQSIGIGEHIQFILRTGYLKNYPPPVSLRRPLARFIQTRSAKSR